MRSNWEEVVRQVEGRPDAEEQSVSLITIHAAKGLEWPIVIPINMTGSRKTESGLMHDPKSNRFSIPIFEIEPGDYADIKAWNAEELARERVRLWYVATTRARDLLVLPRNSKQGTYANIVDFDLSSLGTASTTPRATRSAMIRLTVALLTAKPSARKIGPSLARPHIEKSWRRRSTAWRRAGVHVFGRTLCGRTRCGRQLFSAASFSQR